MQLKLRFRIFQMPLLTTIHTNTKTNIKAFEYFIALLNTPTAHHENKQLRSISFHFVTQILTLSLQLLQRNPFSHYSVFAWTICQTDIQLREIILLDHWHWAGENTNNIPRNWIEKRNNPAGMFSSVQRTKCLDVESFNQWSHSSPTSACEDINPLNKCFVAAFASVIQFECLPPAQCTAQPGPASQSGPA